MSDNSNLMNEDMLREFIRRHASIEAKIKSAQADKGALRKQIKACGEELQDFDVVCREMMREGDDQDYVDRLKRQKRMFDLMGMPIGAQLSFVDEFDAGASVDTAHAYRLGGVAHLAGIEESENPFAANTPEGQDWLKGYRWSVDACSGGATVIDDDGEADAGGEDAGDEPTKRKKSKRKAAKKTTKKATNSAGATA